MLPVHSRARGFSLLELIIVIAIIVLLLAGLVTLLGRLKENTRRKDAGKQIEAIAAALEMYHGSFRAFPPDNQGGRSGSQSLFYFLTTAFSKTPNASRGEVQATITWSASTKFQERELADPVTLGSKTIVDPWRHPIRYKLEQRTFVDPVDATKTETIPTPVVYSCGPNGDDDGGAGDDIGLGK